VSRFVEYITHRHPTITLVSGSNWNVTFTVPVAGVDDNVLPGDEAVIIFGHGGSDESAPTGWTRTANPSSPQIRWRIYQRTLDGSEVSATVATTTTTRGPWAILVVVRCPNPGSLIGATAQTDTAAAVSHPCTGAPSPSGANKNIRGWVRESNGALTFGTAPPLDLLDGAGYPANADFYFGDVVDPVISQPTYTPTTGAAVNGHMVAVTLRHAAVIEPPTLVDDTPGNIGLLP